MCCVYLVYMCFDPSFWYLKLCIDYFRSYICLFIPKMFWTLYDKSYWIARNPMQSVIMASKAKNNDSNLFSSVFIILPINQFLTCNYLFFALFNMFFKNKYWFFVYFSLQVDHKRSCNFILLMLRLLSLQLDAV